jgi:hypothetical protein
LDYIYSFNKKETGHYDYIGLDWRTILKYVFENRIGQRASGGKKPSLTSIKTPGIAANQLLPPQEIFSKTEVR